MVRNSIILVDFIEQRLAEGMPLAQAVVDAGAVRFRSILLTAMAVVVGASVMVTDPIFQGLALSLMAGEIASLLISRMAVPVLYFMAHNRTSLLDPSSRATTCASWADTFAVNDGKIVPGFSPARQPPGIETRICAPFANGKTKPNLCIPKKT